MKNIVKGHKGFFSTPIEVRFKEKTKISDDPKGCWVWVGATTGNGYASIWHENRERRASQVAWELANGMPFPIGMMACHTCDNPGCVNPEHIWPGTMSENIKDARIKGRLRTMPPRMPRKISCDNGHPMDGDNVGFYKRGGRFCRACKVGRDHIHSKLRVERRKQARAAAVAALTPSPAPVPPGEKT